MKNPLKLNWKTEAWPITILLASSLLSIYLYQNSPDIVASHWNISGEIDGYSTKTMISLLIPGIVVLMYVIFNLAPLFDPKRERYLEFRSAYLQMRNAIMLFMLLVFAASGMANLGYSQIKISTVIPLLVGLLFIFIGNLMGKIKSNWYVGLKNPWTLSDQDVWNKANRFSGKSFIIAGLLIAIEGWLPTSMRLPIFLIAIAIAALLPTVYSFFLYNKYKKNGENK